jgi:hypothetical protein
MHRHRRKPIKIKLKPDADPSSRRLRAQAGPGMHFHAADVGGKLRYERYHNGGCPICDHGRTPTHDWNW